MPPPPWRGWPPRPPVPGSRARLVRRLVVLGLIGVLAAVGVAAGAVWWGTEHYGGQVARIPDAFPTGVRPPVPPGHDGGTTFLLAGVDSRSRRPTTGNDATAPLWRVGAQRSDTLMLVHLDADGRDAFTLSIPRDSWVPIPGHGSAKVNAAFSWGGPALLVQTVEQLTGTRIDHFGIIDWSGFRRLTDTVGGVPVTVAADTYDPEQHHGFTAGTHLMDGTEALAYVRQRHGLPGGELDRIERQQEYLRSLVGRIEERSGLRNPIGTARTIDAITGTLSVDDHLTDADLLGLVLGLRRLDTAHAVFDTAPIVRSQMIHGQYALILDRGRLRGEWHAVETGHAPGTGR
ncbi:LCP family protein [Streptomyces longwoodensis]|uniref:LCP family protein n=1 Tax=Streptomyces longwoodensis TaxID=68231 RepID=UPI0033B75A98